MHDNLKIWFQMIIVASIKIAMEWMQMIKVNIG